jgi:hypothetical protein
MFFGFFVAKENHFFCFVYLRKINHLKAKENKNDEEFNK